MTASTLVDVIHLLQLAATMLMASVNVEVVGRVLSVPILVLLAHMVHSAA